MAWHDMSFSRRRWNPRAYQGAPGPQSPWAFASRSHVLPGGGVEEGGRGRKQGRAEKPGVADCNRRMHRPIPITIRLDMV